MVHIMEILGEENLGQLHTYIVGFINHTCTIEADLLSCKLIKSLGRDCGSVGRAFASNTIGPRFESRHLQFFKRIYLLKKRYKDKEKDAGNGPFKKVIIK